MGRRNVVLGAVAGLFIVVAAVYHFTRPSATADLPRQVGVNCACLECRQHVRVSAKVSDPRPYECPECGARAAYPLLECRDCGKKFVPNLGRYPDEEFPLMPVVPSCLACGSRNVGGYKGDETIPAEELVLPEWP
jgi:hypothetical protein